jgi:hypothetical protein
MSIYRPLLSVNSSEYCVSPGRISCRANGGSFDSSAKSLCMESPLHFAAGHGHAAVTKQLIAARCNVDLQAGEELTTPASEGGAQAVQQFGAIRV